MCKPDQEVHHLFIRHRPSLVQNGLTREVSNLWVQKWNTPIRNLMSSPIYRHREQSTPLVLGSHIETHPTVRHTNNREKSLHSMDYCWVVEFGRYVLNTGSMKLVWDLHLSYIKETSTRNMENQWGNGLRNIFLLSIKWWSLQDKCIKYLKLYEMLIWLKFFIKILLNYECVYSLLLVQSGLDSTVILTETPVYYFYVTN